MVGLNYYCNQKGKYVFLNKGQSGVLPAKGGD
jgi:hypothetical protein